jgi:hypothetical protein
VNLAIAIIHVVFRKRRKTRGEEEVVGAFSVQQVADTLRDQLLKANPEMDGRVSKDEISAWVRTLGLNNPRLVSELVAKL